MRHRRWNSPQLMRGILYTHNGLNIRSHENSNRCLITSSHKASLPSDTFNNGDFDNRKQINSTKNEFISRATTQSLYKQIESLTIGHIPNFTIVSPPSRECNPMHKSLSNKQFNQGFIWRFKSLSNKFSNSINFFSTNSSQSSNSFTKRKTFPRNDSQDKNPVAGAEETLDKDNTKDIDPRLHNSNERSRSTTISGNTQSTYKSNDLGQIYNKKDQSSQINPKQNPPNSDFENDYKRNNETISNLNSGFSHLHFGVPHMDALLNLLKSSTEHTLRLHITKQWRFSIFVILGACGVSSTLLYIFWDPIKHFAGQEGADLLTKQILSNEALHFTASEFSKQLIDDLLNDSRIQVAAINWVQNIFNSSENELARLVVRVLNTPIVQQKVQEIIHKNAQYLCSNEKIISSVSNLLVSAINLPVARQAAADWFIQLFNREDIISAAQDLINSSIINDKGVRQNAQDLSQNVIQKLLEDPSVAQKTNEFLAKVMLEPSFQAMVSDSLWSVVKLSLSPKWFGPGGNQINSSTGKQSNDSTIPQRIDIQEKKELLSKLETLLNEYSERNNQFDESRVLTRALEMLKSLIDESSSEVYGADQLTQKSTSIIANKPSDKSDDKVYYSDETLFTMYNPDIEIEDHELTVDRALILYPSNHLTPETTSDSVKHQVDEAGYEKPDNKKNHSTLENTSKQNRKHDLNQGSCFDKPFDLVKFECNDTIVPQIKSPNLSSLLGSKTDIDETRFQRNYETFERVFNSKELVLPANSSSTASQDNKMQKGFKNITKHSNLQMIYFITQHNNPSIQLKALQDNYYNSGPNKSILRMFSKLDLGNLKEDVQDCYSKGDSEFKKEYNIVLGSLKKFEDNNKIDQSGLSISFNKLNQHPQLHKGSYYDVDVNPSDDRIIRQLLKRLSHVKVDLYKHLDIINTHISTACSMATHSIRKTQGEVIFNQSHSSVGAPLLESSMRNSSIRNQSLQKTQIEDTLCKATKIFIDEYLLLLRLRVLSLIYELFDNVKGTSNIHSKDNNFESSNKDAEFLGAANTIIINSKSENNL